jgi:hypothetical protein
VKNGTHSISVYTSFGPKMQVRCWLSLCHDNMTKKLENVKKNPFGRGLMSSKEIKMIK